MSKIAERLKIARAKAGFENASEAAQAFGWKASTYLGHENGSRGFKLERALEYSRRFGVSPDWLMTGAGGGGASEVLNGDPAPDGTNLVPVYDVSASAGHGSIVDAEDHISNLAFSSQYLREMTSAKGKQLAAIRVKGDSMSPTIQDDDMVVIDTTKASLDYDGMFVIRVGEVLQIKRIGRGTRKSSVMVIADNSLYPPVDTDRSEIEVVGKVIWYGRKV